MLIWLVFCILTPLPGCSKAGKDGLDGTWTGVSAEGGSGSLDKPDNPVKEFKIVFKEDKCIMTDKKKTTEMTYKVDDSSTPKSIDFFVKPDGGRKAIWRGLYSLDGDKLTLCLTEDLDKERPKDFVVKPGGSNGVFILQREKE
jgi:uncharacterized protein (TIGR03067 family)